MCAAIDGVRAPRLSSEKPAERTPSTIPPTTPARSQKAVKPPKPRKVEKKQRGRKG